LVNTLSKIEDMAVEYFVIWRKKFQFNFSFLFSLLKRE